MPKGVATDSLVEIEESVDLIDHVRPRPRAGQGRSMDPAVRRVIEQYAMHRAIAYFSSRWARVQDVSSRACFDLLCTDGSREMRVEVKGTTSAGVTVLMTKNEVNNARRMPPTSHSSSQLTSRSIVQSIRRVPLEGVTSCSIPGTSKRASSFRWRSRFGSVPATLRSRHLADLDKVSRFVTDF